ncbi:MAG: protein kinase [Victivallales bacterium]|nr:protein kinase [Victivallales bacterium]
MTKDNDRTVRNLNEPEDMEATRRISVYEREQIDTEWEKAMDGDLASAADTGSGTQGERLEVDAGDSPEFRSKLNDVNRRYKFLEKYAEGGFGIIYKAKDRTLDRVVIIKSLRQEYRDDEISVKRFISEAKLNAQLDHPAIVPLYSLDSDTEKGLHLAMKFIDGLTLKDYLVRLKVKYNLSRVTQPMERKSLRHRLEYFIKICQAVEYSHSREVIHCDLKPENIMIGSYGELYIMDWGTAAAPGIASTGTIEGTPAYLSPETLASGKTGRLSDIFSLGMILYELVTLKRAVDGESVQDIITNIRMGKFEPVEHYKRELKVQPGLKAIIHKSMAHHPCDRYQGVEDLAEDVRRFMFHEEVLARPDTPLQKIARRMYHNRVKSFGFLSILLLMMAGLTAFSFYREAKAGDEAGFKILRYIRFQNSTEAQANDIEKYFMHIQNLLRSYSSNLVFVLDNQFEDKYKGKIYSLEDFRKKSTQPNDLRYSKAYAGLISLNYPVYYAVKRVNPKVLEKDIRKIYKLRGLSQSVILQSEPDMPLTSGNREALLELMLNEGVAAKRLFVVLENGLFVTYPGSGDIRFEGDLLSWDWYSRAVSSRNIVWGRSYLSTNGEMMLPCATPLVNGSGQMLGVAGVDMDFKYIIRRLMYHISFQEGIEKYIINENGQVVVSSIYSDYSSLTGATRKVNALRSFLYNDVLEEMKAAGERQVDKIIDGEKYTFSYAPIPSLEWNFVQIMKSDKLISSDPSRINAQEQKTIEKYQEYRNTALNRYIRKIKETVGKTITTPAEEPTENGEPAPEETPEPQISPAEG